jgi:hypothetical protein
MQRLPGIICLVVGVLLLWWGHNMAQSIGSQFENAFTGSPGDKPMWLYITGTILVIAGISQIAWKRK